MGVVGLDVEDNVAGRDVSDDEVLLGVDIDSDDGEVFGADVNSDEGELLCVDVEEKVIVVFEAAVTECEYIETRSSNVSLCVFNIKTSSVEQAPTFDPVITLDSREISV